MAKPLWIQHFEEQLQGLEAFYNEVERSESLLSFALAKELLKEEDYLLWAQKHFEIAKIKGSYFVDLAPSESLWNKYRENFTWSQDCIPVGIWEQHLLIATIDPEKFNSSVVSIPATPTIFFLADTSSIKRWYEKYQSFQTNSISSTVAPEAAVADNPSSDLLELQDEVVDVVSENELLEIEEGSPEGFDGHLNLEALNEPEGIENSASKAPPLDLDFTALRSNTVTKAEVASEPTNSGIQTEFTNTAVAIAKAPPPPPPPPVGSTGSIRPIPHVSAATLGANPTSGFSMDPWKADFLKTESQKAFSQMKSHFEKSLILAISDDESKLKVQFWDDGFKKPQNEKVIPLKTPSIFNIVAQTVKPFHGPISLNEINEQFFEIWNQAQIPSHVTITPIVVQDKLVGMLMGIAGSQAFNKATLNFAEKLSTEISKDLTLATAA